MTETEFRKEIKSARGGKERMSGVYFLYGDEDYTKNACVRDIKEYTSQSDPMAQFNMIILDYGEGEFEMSDVENALASPAMMSDTKTVIVSFASFDSSFPSSRKKGGDGEDEKKTKGSQSDRFELFLSLLDAHKDDTELLVIVKASSGGFDYGTARDMSPRLKKLAAAAKCVRFDFNSPDMLRKWLCRHAAEYGVTMSPPALDYMLACSGQNMYTLLGEIEKVCAYCAEKGIPAATVRECAECCSRTDEDSAFGLANALTNGNTAEAYTLLGVKMRLRCPPELLLGQIAKNYTDLAAASLFIADGRDAADFASSLKISPKRAAVVYSAAKRRSPAYFAYAVRLCAAANKNMRTVNSKGYGEIELLVSRLSPSLFTEPEKSEDDDED